ncbi:MAG TPA: hypothetical protein VHW05_11695 [Phenylobacterium sp.]|nr:hypothetical protein [Phenylobacterium sp.]
MNLIHAAVDIVPHLPVGESQDAISLGLQPTLAFNIARSDIDQAFVDSAVHLDHQSPSMTCEVGEVPADRRLSAEVRVKLPQFLPKALFRPGRTPLEASRTRRRPWRLVNVLEHHAAPSCRAT